MYLLNVEISDSQNNEIFPQVIHMGLDYDFEAPNSITQVRVNAPLSVAPNLDSFHLDPDTNLTDIVTQAYAYTMGLLVSERLFNALKNHTLQPFVAYPARVVHQNQSFAFHWLHFTKKLEPEIDFEQSDFVEVDADGNTTPLQFANVVDLHLGCKSVVQKVTSRLTPRKIQFVSGTPSYDLFFLDLVPRLILISSPLRETLLGGSYTGFQIAPVKFDIRFG